MGTNYLKGPLMPDLMTQLHQYSLEPKCLNKNTLIFDLHCEKRATSAHYHRHRQKKQIECKIVNAEILNI